MDDEPEYGPVLAVDAGAVGVDLYIGEVGFVYRGWGPVILRQFLDQIVFSEMGATVCVIDPAVSNRAAIRAYEKTGFRWIKTIDVPGEDEPSYIMRLTRAELGASNSR